MDSGTPASSASFYAALSDLCVARLKDALNPTTRLFDRQLRDKSWQPTEGTEDLTSTAICLIGVHRAGVDPAAIGLDVQETLVALKDVTRRRAYPGGLGLVLWANAVWGGTPALELAEDVGLSLRGAPAMVAGLTTMELAWLVSGLTHERARGSQSVGEALGLARGELVQRYEAGTRLFRHASSEAPAQHRVRLWVPNFADQIYSVQAMAFLAAAERSTAARDVASGCANRLVELQGALGQWWWHYDPRRGVVASGYPVYSVHQHAMAPMALMSVTTAGGPDYREAIRKSHAWLTQNELGVNLVDRAAGTVWRDIEIDEGALGKLTRNAKSVLGWTSPGAVPTPTSLFINYETRPYEWAWCLFAGAIDKSADRRGHLV